MTELDQQIVQLMKGPAAPQTVKDLVAACAPAKQATIFSKLSALLNSGELTRDELPWRKDKESRTSQGRPKKQQQKALEKKLQQWIDEDGKDRVAAAKTLMELRMTGQEVTGPPQPNDKEGTINALMQQLAAVGRDWATEAFNRLWPPQDVVDIVIDPVFTPVPAPGLDVTNMRPGRVILVDGGNSGEEGPMGTTTAG